MIGECKGMLDLIRDLVSCHLVSFCFILPLALITYSLYIPFHSGEHSVLMILEGQFKVAFSHPSGSVP